MHYFIFGTKSSWISSGSSHIDSTDFKDQNFGRDQVLEIKKEFWNREFDYPTRALVSFVGDTYTKVKNLVTDGDIPGDAKYSLKMFEAQGNTDMATPDSSMLVAAVSESWTEGIGKFGDNPKTTDGVSWKNRSWNTGASEISWSSAGGTILSVSSSTMIFADRTSADIDVDVTDMVTMWNQGESGNFGMRISFTPSNETNTSMYGKFNYFSTNTHTIYAPRLEVSWDGHTSYTGSNGSNTGSLTELDVSGNTDNFIYTIGWQDKYRETDVPKFRIGARKQFIQKSFTDSYNTTSGSYIPEGSGSYAIVDVATGEKVIDFSDNSKLSCDTKSNYFIEYMNGFYPDRTYKVLIKVKYDDGQERIFDNDFEFKLVR